MARPLTLCPGCNKRPKKKHHNAKWCTVCAAALLRAPASVLTEAQKQFVLASHGKLTYAQIQERLGVSSSAITRYKRDAGISLRVKRYAPEVISDVLACYEEHGKHETQQRFPDVCIRSVVERCKHKPRLRRWTEPEIIEAARMAGLIPPDVQAVGFNRPRAHAGSIHSFWNKRMGGLGGRLHGLPVETAKTILRPGFPVIETPLWIARKRGPSRRHRRRLVLWCQMRPWVHPDTPEFIRDAIRTMTQFQKWLFCTRDPAAAIRDLLQIVS